MWPHLLDMSRDEAKRTLRRLELEAYSSLVSALRAQGDLTKEKKKILTDLQHILSISTERHRAEVRRAVNDEVLTTVADNMTGSSMSSEWLVEGRRLIPLMPRLVPQTAFTIAANTAATSQGDKNASMPNPAFTGVKDIVSTSCPTSTSTTAPVTKFTRPSSPTSNVVVLPSGMSIHIKGGLNTEEDEDLPTRTNKRKRSSSVEGPITVTRTSVVTASTQSKVTTSSNTIQGLSPMKITLTKSPARTPSQKVILVSNSGSSSGPSILQRSLSVPVVKTSASSSMSSTVSGNKTSIIVPSTSVTPSNMSIVSSSASSVVSASPEFTAAKPRLKTISARPKTPQGVGIVQVAGSTHNVQTHSGKQAIQIKQEGGMKIITKSVAGATGKILPKPSGGPSVVVVTSGTTSVVSRALSSMQGGKVVNISTSGGKVITTTARNMPNVVTVNPKTLQLTAVKTSSGAITVSAPTKLTTASGTKANVIVVQQKGHPRKPGQAPVATRGPTSVFEKELVSFIQKHEQSKQTGPSKTTVVVKTTESSSQQKPQVKIEEIQTTGKSSLLAELIQAVGIGPENSPGSTPGSQSPITTSIQESGKQKGHEWIDCDEAPDASAIKALLEMQAAGGQTGGATYTPQQAEVYTLEEATSQLLDQGPSEIRPSGGGEGLVLLETDLSSELEQRASGQLPSSTAPQLLTQHTTTVQNSLLSTPSTGPLSLLPPPTLDNTPNLTTTATQLSNLPRVAEPEHSSSDTALDIFSTALASAQIDLDPYQFIDDDVTATQPPPKLTHIHQAHSTIHTNPMVEPTARIVRIDTKGDLLTSGSQIPSSSKGSQSFIPLQDIVAKSGSLTSANSGQSPLNVVQRSTAGPVNVNVYVEPSGSNMDISSMNFDDFTSQRLADASSDYGESYVGLEASTSGDGSDRNLGKRKRKPPPAPDDNPAPSVVGGWIRAALGLLQRVARFRGANREKGEINAAAWFTRPVDPTEAPGYYEVITQPMDFGSIKKKLETTMYMDISEFHSDMLLVRDNCYKYNPPNSDVRLDCDEVFSFYALEYEKLLDRLQKSAHCVSPSSPATKKAKVEKSPSFVRALPLS